jgi:hypothetical protein
LSSGHSGHPLFRMNCDTIRDQDFEPYIILAAFRIGLDVLRDVMVSGNITVHAANTKGRSICRSPAETIFIIYDNRRRYRMGMQCGTRLN